MNKYIKNYILSVSNTVLMLLFPIITFPYVSRILGPTKLGIIDFAQSYGYYFTHIASFGINSYALREVSKVRDDKEKVNRISNELFNLNCFFSLISVLLYYCGILFVPKFRANFIVLAIYSVVILTNFLTLDWLLQSFDDYLFSTIRNMFIRIIAVVSVFFFVKNENDYIIYMAINCITEMGTKVSTLFYSRKKYARLVLSTKYLNFQKHIKSMFTLFTFRLINGISSNLDKLMIGFMMLYSSVGIYSAGVKFIIMLQPIVETVGIVLFPKINISADVSQAEYKKNLKFNYEMILLIGMPMAVGMFLISAHLIPLFAGEEYRAAIGVSRIMSIVLLLGPIGDMLGSKTLLVYKKDKWLLICSSIVAISNVILNYIFIPIWGIYGAAFASVLCYLIAVSSRYLFTLRIVKFRLFTPGLIKYFAFTIPFIVIYCVFKDSIDTNTLYMFAFIGVCIIIYIVELFVSKDTLIYMMLNKFLDKE